MRQQWKRQWRLEAKDQFANVLGAYTELSVRSSEGGIFIKLSLDTTAFREFCEDYLRKAVEEGVE